MLTKQVAIILPLRVAGSLCCYKTARFIAPKVQIFISGNKFVWHHNIVRKFMKQLSVLAIFLQLMIAWKSSKTKLVWSRIKNARYKNS